jgi:cytochrome c biogenesis protein CcdA
MKKSWFVLVILSMILMFSLVSSETQVEYFYGIGCSHCANVADSGVLEKVSEIDGINLVKHEVYYDAKGQERFKEIQDFLNVKANERGVPFLMINCSGKYTYLVGDVPIINNVEKYASTCNFEQAQTNSTTPIISDKQITLGSIIIAALIDSVNPCAFGVLIFLLISLLKVGSSKRALRYGLLYTFIVFIVYFLAGFGIFKVIQTLSFLNKFVYIIAGLLVLTFGIIEFVDYFRARNDKKAILKIPTSAKPMLERITQKGTIFAIITLGVLVSLFELPCTGGIYLAILSLMAKHQTFAWGYLFLYNLIFVLPLIVITLVVYKGMSPERLQRWTNGEKKWMRLAAGVVLVLLGLYLLKGKLF